MPFPLDTEAQEAQRIAALESAKRTRLIVLRHRLAGLRELIRVTETAGSLAKRIAYYQKRLKETASEIVAAEKETA